MGCISPVFGLFGYVYAINIDSDFLRQKELELTAHNILLVY
jgi:hypothetical protein